MQILSFSAAEVFTEKANFESQMAFVLDDAAIGDDIQAHLAKNGVTAMARFTHLADDIPELEEYWK